MSLLYREYIHHIQISLMHKIKRKKEYPAISTERLEDMVNKVSLFDFE